MPVTAPLPPTRPATLLALFALWLVATAALRPLWIPDEGRYASVALEMLSGGDWIVPTMLGLPYFHKPPLLYWISAASMALFGASEFAARIAPALGGWLMGAALLVECRADGPTQDGRLALALLATTPMVFLGAQFANHDMLVAGFIAFAIAAARRALAETGHVDPRWRLVAWCAAAFAVLAKGLIGVVLPALVLVPWLLATRRARDLLRMLHPAGLALFALVAVPWFVAVQRRYPDFLEYFFVEQHFRRYAGSGFNNPQPFWYFLVVLPLGALPWSAWLARPACRFDHAAFRGWWVLAVLGFFSLPASKLMGYVLPAMPALIALLAPAVARGRAWRWLLPAAALTLVAAAIAIAAVAPKSNRDIGLALRTLAGPGDSVVFLGARYFDVPFYARLARPPAVFIDWDDPDIARRDDWRKELRDAGRFDPRAAAHTLIGQAGFEALRCGATPVWVVTEKGFEPSRRGFELEWVFDGRRAVLWRAAAREGCP